MPFQQPEKDLKKKLISQQGPTGLKNYIELVSSCTPKRRQIHVQLPCKCRVSTSNQRPWELGGKKSGFSQRAKSQKFSPAPRPRLLRQSLAMSICSLKGSPKKSWDGPHCPPYPLCKSGGPVDTKHLCLGSEMEESRRRPCNFVLITAPLHDHHLRWFIT